MGKTKGKAKEMKKLKTIKENWDNTTQSADKKPEKYIKPDGKVGIRMVPVKKEGAMKRMATTQSNKTDRMAASDKKGLETYKKKPVDENTEIVEAQDPEMEKVKQLVRIGLMNKKDMTKIVRALTLMKEGKPVPQKERKILFDMLGELIGMITGDDAMFNKARKAVKEEKDMSAMCCKNCGDEFGKPKSEGCMYDAYNAEGKNWIKKGAFKVSESFDHTDHEDNAFAHGQAYEHHKEHGHHDLAAHHLKASDHHEKALKHYSDGNKQKGGEHARKAMSHASKAYEASLDKRGEHHQVSADAFMSSMKTMSKTPVSRVREEVQLDEVLDTPKAMQSYKDKAKYSRDRASGSAAAKILSKGTLGSHKPELDTMRKRHKGMDMADRNAKKKTFAALRGKK